MRNSVRYYLDAISKTFQEYCDSRQHHEAIARRKELMLYVRRLESHPEYRDSEIRDIYKWQTGIGAIQEFGRKLGTKAESESLTVSKQVSARSVRNIKVFENRFHAPCVFQFVLTRISRSIHSPDSHTPPATFDSLSMPQVLHSLASTIFFGKRLCL